MVTRSRAQAVVFDCDGTLLETESRWTIAEQVVCERWDVAFTMVCAGGGVAPKPAPDVYLAACDAVGAAPESSVALEDSPVGAFAARAAGLRVYGVPADGVMLDADVIVTSLMEIAPAHLLEMR